MNQVQIVLTIAYTTIVVLYFLSEFYNTPNKIIRLDSVHKDFTICVFAIIWYTSHSPSWNYQDVSNFISVIGLVLYVYWRIQKYNKDNNETTTQ